MIEEQCSGPEEAKLHMNKTAENKGNYYMLLHYMCNSHGYMTQFSLGKVSRAGGGGKYNIA